MPITSTSRLRTSHRRLKVPIFCVTFKKSSTSFGIDAATLFIFFPAFFCPIPLSIQIPHSNSNKVLYISRNSNINHNPPLHNYSEDSSAS
mmetsp:Transcript_18347/g.21938  ORF Transcript_18347/g.21938 Transcript_18347/m.21938 type:complete len:90 (-) Transcript_18347:645-914(-)